MQNDFSILDYCLLLTEFDEEFLKLNNENYNDEVIFNSWLGPPGSHSPLHFDPFHNLLCQIVGNNKYYSNNFKN